MSSQEILLNPSPTNLFGLLLPKEEEIKKRPFLFISVLFDISATIGIGQEIQGLLYAGFFNEQFAQCCICFQPADWITLTYYYQSYKAIALMIRTRNQTRMTDIFWFSWFVGQWKVVHNRILACSNLTHPGLLTILTLSIGFKWSPFDQQKAANHQREA